MKNKIHKIKKPINKIPRILYLKLMFGSDLIDYIKEEYGIENFLNDIFRQEDERIAFLAGEKIKEFTTQWIIFTDHYKKLFGKKIRDKDAINKLSKEKKFKDISELYSFRCKVFKSDFVKDEKFISDLNFYLKLLIKINKVIIKKRKNQRDWLIQNKFYNV